MTTLMDTVRIEPRRDHRSCRCPGWIPRGTQPSHDPESSFEVESRGRYARTVVGRLAYFDAEAQTYMVLTRDGVLVSAPCCP
jgi:hypothetical protein